MLTFFPDVLYLVQIKNIRDNMRHVIKFLITKFSKELNIFFKSKSVLFTA